MVNASHKGQELVAHWIATASNVSGRQEGDLKLHVEETALSPAELMG
jgi:hypothetical protein